MKHEKSSMNRRSHFEAYLLSLGATRQAQAERLGLTVRGLQKQIKRQPKYPPEYYQALARDAAEHQTAA